MIGGRKQSERKHAIIQQEMFLQNYSPLCKMSRLNFPCVNVHFCMLLLEAMLGLDNLAALHFTSPTEPEECSFLHTRTFTFPIHCQRVKTMHEMREWVFTLSHQEKVEVFQYYKLQLQIMANDEGICITSTHM